MNYRTIYAIRYVMPDNRLAHVKLLDGGEFLIGIKQRKIHPALLGEIAKLSDDVADAGIFTFDGEATEPAVDVAAWFDRVPEEQLQGPSSTMWPRVRFIQGGPIFFETLVHEALVAPEVVTELNVEIMPTVCGTLHVTPSTLWADS